MKTILIITLLSLNLFAKETVADKIVAIVNSDIILSSDIAQFKKNYQDYYISIKQKKDFKSVISNNKKVVAILVNNLLLTQAVKEMNLTVSDVMLEKEISSIMKRNKISKPQLLKILAQEGKTFETFRQARRREIERYKLISKEIKPRVSVNDYDLKNYYQQKISDIPKQLEYELVDFVQKGSSAQLSKVRASLLKSGWTSETKSLCAGKCNELNLGFMSTAALRPEMARALKALKKGESTTKITKIAGVYHLIYIKSAKSTSVESFEEVKEKLSQQYYQIAMDREMLNWLAERRKKAFVELK
jgi:peptidyl-prolyl cis-trans isomerase SurA